MSVFLPEMIVFLYKNHSIQMRNGNELLDEREFNFTQKILSD